MEHPDIRDFIHAFNYLRLLSTHTDLRGPNIFIEAVALGLGAGIVGAFDDDWVAKEVGIGKGQDPMLLLPVGHISHS